VRDRFITSTIIHHQSMDPSINFRGTHDFDKNFTRIQILLIASASSIIDRLSKREYVSRFEVDIELFMKTQELLKKEHNDLIIDTDSNDIQSTLLVAREHVLKALSTKPTDIINNN
jgi:hypothetical protein